MHVNEAFSKLSEALYIAERKSRESVEIRAEQERKKAQKEKEEKEETLRKLAQKAREGKLKPKFISFINILTFFSSK